MKTSKTASTDFGAIPTKFSRILLKWAYLRKVALYLGGTT